MLVRSDVSSSPIRLIHELLRAIDQARTNKDYALALFVIARFLRNAGMSDASHDWFADLYFAVEDLKHGRLDPILIPKKTGNRPPDSMLVWWARAQVAAAATLLANRPGMTRSSAVEMIAGKFPELHRLAAPRAELTKSIRSWRDEFGKRRIKSELARFAYERSVKKFAESESDILEKHITVLLENAVGIGRRLVQDRRRGC